jgi:LPXTG-site transpeptidase (sortase) family protein
VKHRIGSVKPRLLKAAGLVMVICGAVATGYAGFSLYERARSGSDAAEFNVDVPTMERAELLGQVARRESFTIEEAGSGRNSGLYPGDRMNPRYWDDPLWAGGAPYGAPGLPDGFEPVSPGGMAFASGAIGPALGLRIPAIGLDSDVLALEIIDLGDAREYATPVNTVGHIPVTALPGAAGTGWYFGHLESPVRGEGNVFRRLPEIASLIREDAVDVVVRTSGAEYLYRVVSTRQVPQEELSLTDSGSASITLVTCWPTRVYDQRILVNAELIAVRRL